MKKKCPICTINFNARTRDGRVQKYCSRSCYLKAHRNECVCVVCGKKFIIPREAIKNKVHTGQYCSRNCFHESQKGKRVSVKTEFKKGLIPKGGHKTRFKKGKDHPLWKGGISSEYDKIKHREEYTKWRDDVYKRDYWTCQECGKHCESKDITAHHIKSFADYPELRFDVDNGTTYCRGCHLALHNKLRNDAKCALAA